MLKTSKMLLSGGGSSRRPQKLMRKEKMPTTPSSTDTTASPSASRHPTPVREISEKAMKKRKRDRRKAKSG